MHREAEDLLTVLAGPPLSGLKVQSMDMRLVILLEEVKEQVRVTVPPLTTLTSAGAATEIQHTLLSSTDTQTHQRDGVQCSHTLYFTTLLIPQGAITVEHGMSQMDITAHNKKLNPT